MQKNIIFAPISLQPSGKLGIFITRGNKFPKFTNGWRNRVFGKDAEAILNSN